MPLLLFFLFAFSLFAEEPVVTHCCDYTATVSSLPVFDKEGGEKGQISYIAYTREDRGRPITFVFNGGPGSSSVWLHIGAFGPKRIVSPEEGQSVVPPYQLIDNAETLLDLTDLVFIDPIGTGLSYAEDPTPYYEIQGDIHSIGDFLRDYLTATGRWNSPIYLAGESYGTCRACGLAEYLQSTHGIYPNGLILISCVLDFQTGSPDSDNLLPHFLHLPTYAATAWHHDRYHPEATLEEVVREARTFAYETYAPFLLRPHLSTAEKEQLFKQLASMTGLPHNVVQRSQGKLGNIPFCTEFFPNEKKTLGIYDTRCSGNYTQPGFAQDPFATSINGIFSTAFHDYLHRDLQCPVSYKIFSLDIANNWNYRKSFRWGYPNFIPSLRSALVTNPKLKVFIGSGYFDAATPFAATEYSIEHLDLPDSYFENIQSELYEGGHLYYLNPAARKKFKEDLVHFYGR